MLKFSFGTQQVNKDSDPSRNHISEVKNIYYFIRSECNIAMFWSEWQIIILKCWTIVVGNSSNGHTILSDLPVGLQERLGAKSIYRRDYRIFLETQLPILSNLFQIKWRSKLMLWGYCKIVDPTEACGNGVF